MNTFFHFKLIRTAVFTLVECDACSRFIGCPLPIADCLLGFMQQQSLKRKHSVQLTPAEVNVGWPSGSRGIGLAAGK